MPGSTAASPEPAQEGFGSTALPEIFFGALIIALVVIALVEAHAGFLRSPGTDWNTSEWMIDYAAGFVRRGLGGALLLHFLHITGFSFFASLATLTTTAYLALCAALARRSYQTHAPALWRLVLLFNPILLIAAAEYGSFARKDIFFLWGTILTVHLSHRALKKDRAGANPASAFPALALGLVLSVALAALHEGLFLFIWFPLNAAVTFCVIRSWFPAWPARLAGTALTFAPSLAVVLESVRHHGAPDAAQTICESWRFAFSVHCAAGPQFPQAIGALALSMRHEVLANFDFVWKAGHGYLLIFVSLAVLAVALLLLAVLVLEPAAQLEHLLAIAAGSFLCAIPLFILGTDWGRWLFLAATSSLILMFSGPLRAAFYSVLPAPARHLFERASGPIGSGLAVLRNIVERHPGFSLTFMLMLPLPPLPLASAMLLANPLLIFIRFLSQVHGG